MKLLDKRSTRQLYIKQVLGKIWWYFYYKGRMGNMSKHIYLFKIRG